MGTTAKPGEFPRTIEHARGETELKKRPRRVVVLDVGELGNVVSLGVKPVGYAPTEGDDGVPGYLKKEAGSPKDVGMINSLNLEAIAALKPDLILGSELAAYGKRSSTTRVSAAREPADQRPRHRDQPREDRPGRRTANEVLGDLKTHLAP